MSVFELYVLTTIPSVGYFFVTVSIVTAILSGFGVMVYAMVNDEMLPNPARNTLIAVILVCGFIGVLIPGERAMYTIVGGYIATNIEDVEKLPANTVKALNKLLEDYTEQDNSQE